MPAYRVYVVEGEFEHGEAYQQGDEIEATSPLDAIHQVVSKAIDNDKSLTVADLKRTVYRAYLVSQEIEASASVVVAKTNG